eukprot:gene11957-8537_t
MAANRPLSARDSLVAGLVDDLVAAATEQRGAKRWRTFVDSVVLMIYTGEEEQPCTSYFK